jgi:SpoVK/Ycf46/Vps4 family AAA+-type ATPase
MRHTGICDWREDSTYNGLTGDDPQEAVAVSSILAEYWESRSAQLSSVLRQHQNDASDVAVEEKRFADYCRRHVGVLAKYFSKASNPISAELTSYWKLRFRDTDVASNTKKEFRRDGQIELLLPIQTSPARFLRVPGRNGSTYDWVDYPNLNDPRIAAGKPILAVRWREFDPLFFVHPSGGYFYFNTIHYTKNGMKWTTDEVIPRLFAETLADFQSDLNGFEQAFDALRSHWRTNAEIARLQDRSLRLQKAAGVWAAVKLPERQKLEILRGAELFETGDAAAPRGLLLTGPPGTGKTLVGRTLAETLGCDFQSLSLADLKEVNLGASGKKVRAVWDHARNHQPAIVFLDECEGVLGRRGAAETDVIATDIVQAFLAEWDGIRGQARVWVVGATNRRDMLDDAILSRFGWEIDLKLPAEDDRRQILAQEVRALGLDADAPTEVAALTQGMSGRDLQQLARSARALAYPAIPAAEHFLQAIGAMRTTHNTKVDVRAGWDTLVLEASILDRLKLACTLLRDAEKWSAQGVSIPRSLLLVGPSGVGKTQIARTLANESGLTFLAATTADVKANFLGQSGNRVKQLFERARSSAPAILFLDELDVIAPDRLLVGGNDQMTDEIVGQLLQEMDGIQARESQVFLMAATNHLERIDAAIRSRFQEKIVIPLPDREARIKLLTILLRGKKIVFALDDGAVLLADLTEGRTLSGRDLESWVQAAEQKALMRALREGGPDRYAILLDDFDNSIDRIEQRKE